MWLKVGQPLSSPAILADFLGKFFSVNYSKLKTYRKRPEGFSGSYSLVPNFKSPHDWNRKGRYWKPINFGGQKPVKEKRPNCQDSE